MASLELSSSTPVRQPDRIRRLARPTFATLLLRHRLLDRSEKKLPSLSDELGSNSLNQLAYSSFKVLKYL